MDPLVSRIFIKNLLKTSKFLNPILYESLFQYLSIGRIFACFTCVLICEQNKVGKMISALPKMFKNKI
jgi:hypothetical protein